MSSHAASKRIMLDCRWLGYSGIGRTTEMLLEALSLEPPPGHWTLLVQDRLDTDPWPGVAQLVGKRHPESTRKELTTRLPSSDLIVFPQMIRPPVARRSVQFIHDFTPVDVSPPGLVRFVRSAYLFGLARNATTIMSEDPTVPDRLVRDYRIDPRRIVRATLPVDTRRAERLRDRRQREASDGSLLFVGRFAPHKNLEAFAAAFARSAWDGPLLLLGSPEPAITASLKTIADDLQADIRIIGHVSEAELETAYARARAVVLPSLFEGFGLPVQEAAAAGIPVICSRTIPAASLLADQRATFDPRDPAEMVAAVNHVHAARPDDQVAISGDLEQRTPERLRAELLAAVAQALAHRGVLQRSWDGIQRGAAVIRPGR